MPIEIPSPHLAGSDTSVLVEVLAEGTPAASLAYGRASNPGEDPPPAKPPSALARFDLDAQFAPIGMRPARGARGAFSSASREGSSVFRVTVRGQEEFDQLRHSDGVMAVWADPLIAPFPGVDCNSTSTTTSALDVAAALGASRVWQDHGFRGDGITIGIVDGGVDASLLPAGSVTGGWSPDPAFPPGAGSPAWKGHGNMCAFDAHVASPNASLHDYAIGRTAGSTTAMVSTATRAFDQAIGLRLQGAGPDILSNSWGLYQQAWDPFPPGHPSNYTHNLNHPFHRKVQEAIDAGILVVFAAGNCGEICPDGRCGADVGIGRSIRGANGAPHVICVGAANVARDWIGYSSQGPSSLDLEKPDVCGYSHFQGHTACDNGTSAACPVVAGVLGLMLQARPGMTQDHARSVLRNAAVHPLAQRWDSRYGRGIVDAYTAVHALV